MIIGIDLGTTNSLASIFMDGEAQIIQNALGEMLTPSAVHIEQDGNAVVGASAKAHLVNAPDRTTSKFKRLMGTSQFTKFAGKNFRPEDLSALILKSLKEDAEAFLGESVTEAVISVPAYFNDTQRKATRVAAELAGLNVRRLINEPTAAALAYGLHAREDENTFLVIDLGGGTFDVSILEMFSGVMEVRSSAGDAFLGGEDFTDRILQYFASQAGLDVATMARDDLSRLRALANQAKHALAEKATATVNYRKDKTELPLTISRDKLEELTQDLVNRMKIPIQRAINDAGLKTDEIDRIVLVGGATRMPQIRALVTRLFKRFPEHHIDPDIVVAMGAAVQAGLLERDEALEDVVMTDVSPFTLGYEVSREVAPGRYEHGMFSPLIERNTTIPASRNHLIVPVSKGQVAINIDVYQGESPYVADNIKIGSYEVPIPYNTKELEEVDLRFTYDNSGILEVIARVVSTDKEKRLVIENNPGVLTAKEIEQRFKELEKIKIHPREEAANEAVVSRMKAAFENALGDKRMEITMLLTDFEQVLASYDKRAIEKSRAIVLERLQLMEDGFVIE